MSVNFSHAGLALHMWVQGNLTYLSTKFKEKYFVLHASKYGRSWPETYRIEQKLKIWGICFICLYRKELCFSWSSETWRITLRWSQSATWKYKIVKGIIIYAGCVCVCVCLCQWVGTVRFWLTQVQFMWFHSHYFSSLGTSNSTVISIVLVMQDLYNVLYIVYMWAW